MRLSTKTRYGVQALFDIAFHSVGRPTQAKDIARRQEIPLRYLEQIFQDLRRAGLVDSRRGPRGGYHLRLAPAEIRLGDVVRSLQGPIEDLVRVEDGDPASAAASGRPRGRRAPHSGRVVAESVFTELAGQVAAWFDAVSLADLVTRGQALGLAREEQKRPMYFI